jgi:ribosomal protein L7/L12
MKLDKMQFAHVLAHCISNGMSAGDYEIEELDRRIDVPVPEQQKFVSFTLVDELLAAMNQPGKKIAAIKAYRELTGEGLRESKNAVERYWTNNEHYSPLSES